MWIQIDTANKTSQHNVVSDAKRRCCSFCSNICRRHVALIAPFMRTQLNIKCVHVNWRAVSCAFTSLPDLHNHPVCTDFNREYNENAIAGALIKLLLQSAIIIGALKFTVKVNQCQYV